MLPFTSHSDPGDEQLELDVPAQRVCTCGATDPGACQWNRYEAVWEGSRRPRTCLRRHDPSKADIPF